MVKRAVLIVLLLSAAVLLAAETSSGDETVFESKIYSKETKQVYGSGALSVATTSFTILVLNKDAYMKIEVPEKAFNVLKPGDVVRVTYTKGLFENEIKAIALLRSASKAKE